MTDPWDHLAAEMKAEQEERKLPFVRASSMPRFFDCASSEDDTDHPIDYDTGAGRMGIGNHKAIATTVEGTVPVLAQIAEDFGIELNDLVATHTNARRIWDRLRPYFPEGTQPEAKVRGSFTGGTADLIYADGHTMAFLDWKFGMVKRNNRPQVTSYAYAAVERLGFPESGQIDAWVAYPRLDDEPEHFAILPEDLEAFRERFMDQARKVGKVYSPGDACNFCRLRFECAARANWIRSAANAVAEVQGRELTSTELGELYPQAKALEKALEQYSKALTAAVKAEGEVLTGDGRKLTMNTVFKESIDARKAWAVLKRHGFDDDGLNGIITLGKTKVVNVLKEQAPRGKKTARVQEVWTELEEAGAISRFTYEKLQPRKA